MKYLAAPLTPPHGTPVGNHSSGAIVIEDSTDLDWKLSEDGHPAVLTVRGVDVYPFDIVANHQFESDKKQKKFEKHFYLYVFV